MWRETQGRGERRREKKNSNVATRRYCDAKPSWYAFARPREEARRNSRSSRDFVCMRPRPRYLWPAFKENACARVLRSSPPPPSPRPPPCDTSETAVVCINSFGFPRDSSSTNRAFFRGRIIARVVRTVSM